MFLTSPRFDLLTCSSLLLVPPLPSGGSRRNLRRGIFSLTRRQGQFLAGTFLFRISDPYPTSTCANQDQGSKIETIMHAPTCILANWYCDARVTSQSVLYSVVERSGLVWRCRGGSKVWRKPFQWPQVASSPLEYPRLLSYPTFYLKPYGNV